MQSAIVVFPGSNREQDLFDAQHRASGKKPLKVWHRESVLPKADLIVIPGGFSYGDYLRCGAMAAHSPIMREIKAQAAAGTPVLGICNGFQIITEAGLLPGALLANTTLKFHCMNVHLRVETSQTIYTSRYQAGPGDRPVPVAHHDGNYFADRDTLDRLEGEGRVAFRYCGSRRSEIEERHNPNGSARSTSPASSTRPKPCSGLMPHPEDAIASAARLARRACRSSKLGLVEALA